MKFFSWKTLLFSLVISSICLFSCTESSTDDIPPEDLVPGVMTEAQIQLNLALWGISINGNWGSMMVQYWSNPNRLDRTLYGANGIAFDDYWQAMFTQVLNPLREIKNFIDDGSGDLAVKTNQKAIADILTVYTFHNLTDGFGDMPVLGFFEASVTTTPPYDRQEAIYRELLSILDQAVQQLDESAAAFPSGDIIYNGDVLKWRKFGYSLMLRMAMRIADVDASLAEQYVKKTEGKVFSSNDDNALFVFAGSPSIANPFFTEFNLDGRDDFHITTAFLAHLENTSDPRLPQLLGQTQAEEYVGLPYGDEPTGDVSKPNQFIRRIDAPATMMDYSEVAFLLAEAYQRNFLSGSAEGAYNDGIRASMTFWRVIDVAAINTYLGDNAYNAANWRASLGVQKWVAMFANGPQAWAEWRRLDFPVLTPAAEGLINSIPVRLPYPESEQVGNSTQLGIITNTPDDLTAKVWWDVN